MEQNYDEPVSNGKKTLWIVGGIILVVMIVALVYAATQKTLKTADQNADSDTVMLQNKNNTTPAGTSGTDTQVLGAENMIDSPVTVTGLDVVNLQTVPQKIQAHVSYTLLGNCAVLDAPATTFDGKKITVNLTAHTPKNTVCTKDVLPGDVTIDIPMEGYPAGTYTVKAGSKTKSIVLKSDNQINTNIDK